MKRNAKVWALVLAVAIPGMSTLSCTTSVLQEFRDASVTAAADAIGLGVGAWVASYFPMPE